MFIFDSPFVLRNPLTDYPESLPYDRNLAEFDNPTTKIPEAFPAKKFGAKNMQNFRQFCTTSDFDREYLRNDATYPKLENLQTMAIPPVFNEKSPVNFGPLTT